MNRRIICAGIILCLFFPAGCQSSTKHQEIPSPAAANQSLMEEHKLDNYSVITIATGDMSGVYYSLGQAIADTYEKNSRKAVAAQVTNASIQNTELVSQKEAELGFASVDVLNRTGTSKGAANINKIRALTGLYSNYVHIVTSEKSGIKELSDLDGKRISVGTEGSGTKLIAERTLSAAGLSDTVHKYELSFSQSSDALRNGIIDAAFYSSGLPNPEISEISGYNTGVKLVPIPEKIVNELTKRYGFYTPKIIPADTYSNINHDTMTISVRNVLLTHVDLSNKEAYDLVHFFYTHLSELQKIHPAAKEIQLQNAKIGIPIAFHPGAQTYYSDEEIHHD
ncbi:TAXI family TRAP transporter solute-binding subunit [Bacillus sp. V2I10]|uniref:TAXI family TRAP transporter solute-binding subunit n=1 Tax=Bacillus sp. V2I10 TaxID=3042276 RepID=UPI0027807819|nr:TAXI family TRAP transporter solute-binding subunit [Bacillus sp. V2I10]MDQ0860978.1 TRAP transporter TAXI family solute receptor [Bacillus sp. V2I10]